MVQRREDGHVTDVVDKSLMTNFSGATANELISALKYLKLIGDKGEPSERYKQYVMADDESRKAIMGDVLREAYPWVFDTTKFNIERATTAQFTELFRQQGPQGSTLARGIAFFLGMAKFAGIKVSPNIKVPSGLRASGSRPKKETPPSAKGAPREEGDEHEEGQGDDESLTTKVMKVHIPIPIGRRVTVIVPHPWTGKDWDKFKAMLNLYTEDWDEQQATFSIHKDKGPTPTE